MFKNKDNSRGPRSCGSRSSKAKNDGKGQQQKKKDGGKDTTEEKQKFLSYLVGVFQIPPATELLAVSEVSDGQPRGRREVGAGGERAKRHS